MRNILLIILLVSTKSYGQALCTVSDTLKTQNGTILANSPVKVFGAILSSTKTPIDLATIEYRSDGGGIVSFQIYRQATCWIQANYLTYNVSTGRHVVIPNTATALLRNLQAAP